MSAAKRGRSLAEIMNPIDDLSEAVGAPPAEVPSPRANSQPPIVPINVLVTPGDRKRLRQLSLDADTSLQKLGHEAWNMLLRSRGLPPLEPVTANIQSGRTRRRS
jgi:hypothetical protein